MKLLKFSFAAIIAVGTLAVTLVAQAGLLNKEIAKAAVDDGCYRSITIAQEPSTPPIQVGTYNASNNNPVGSLCIATAQATSLPVSGPGVSATLGSLSQSGVVTAINTSVDPQSQCAPQLQPFCCFDVVDDKVVGICFGTYQE